MKFGIGQSILRKEDDPLLRGHGHYSSDFFPAGMLHALVLRSPHAKAKFSIDVARARALPGVSAILTAEDVADLGPLPCRFNLPDGSLKVPPYDILAKDEVRHVGDAIAFVVASSVDTARDALEAIDVDWQPTAAAIGVEAAVAPGAPQVWPTHPSNLAYDYAYGDKDETEAVFAKAHAIAEIKIINQRLITNYMEPRSVLAEYDAANDKFTLTLGSQGAHNIRNVLCKSVFKMPITKMRVITPDTGGGFGTRLYTYREYALAAVAARKVGKPVRWLADRADHFLGDAQGRDNVTTARMALAEDGRFLALQSDTLADMGAYFSFVAPYVPFGGTAMLPGVYDIPKCHLRVRAVFTNTVPVDAYRGAGRPEAAYVIERLVDAAARKLGMTPDAIRRKNYISPKSMPYTTQTGKIYDTGNFAAHLKVAQDMIDWKGFPKRAKAAKKAGKVRGIGIATYIEICGALGPETATVSLDGDGDFTVLIGSQSTGQGHQTAYAQLVAEHIGVAPERVRVVQGDTDRIATGLGTGGSSSIPAGGVSVDWASRKLGDNLKALAADALEASPADIELADGTIRVVGTDRAMSFAELARRPGIDLSKLTISDVWKPQPTYPNGTHIAEVEIDPETGTTAIVNYVVCDDFGVTLNPVLLQGQIQGGVVQGIGQALMEQGVYDESGQLVTGTLMDYALPRAADVPNFAFETRNVPCLNNPLGVKGAGEAGTVGAAPAVMNAINEALWREFGVSQIDMPATPAKVWAAVRAAS